MKIRAKIWNMIFLSDTSKWQEQNVTLESLNFTDITSPNATTAILVNMTNLASSYYHKGGRVYIEIAISQKGDLRGLTDGDLEIVRLFIELPGYQPPAASPRVVPPWVWVLVVLGLLAACGIVVYVIRYRRQQEQEMREIQKELLREQEEKHHQ